MTESTDLATIVGFRRRKTNQVYCVDCFPEGDIGEPTEWEPVHANEVKANPAYCAACGICIEEWMTVDMLCEEMIALQETYNRKWPHN